jgi:flagellin
VSSTLKNNARLFGAAVRNANDGLSALNIIDSSLGNQSDILVRLKELAEQSANGSLSSTQRRTLDDEYQLLLTEFTRLANTTKFNGLDLLIGAQGNLANGLNLQIGISGENSSVLGTSTHSGRALQGVVKIKTDIAGPGGILGSDGQESADDAIAGVDILFGATGLTRAELESVFGDSLTTTTVIDSNGVSRDVITGVTALYTTSAVIYATYELASDGTYTFLGKENPSTYLNNQAQGSLITTALSFSDGASATLQQDFRGVTFLNPLYYSVAETAVGFSSIELASRARSALDLISSRQDLVSLTRGEIGALQSRLSSALRVLGAGQENSLAAASRIEDIDVATEAAEVTRLRILQETGVALLAQQRSNSILVLDLLGQD